MKVYKTERGFEVVEFKDIYGNKCSLQQSSIALCETPGVGAIWFGVDDNRMHIDLSLLKELLPYLQRWAKDGSFCKREDGVTQLSSAIMCYSLMDQAGLLRLRQAFESDLIGNIDTEEGVVFASMREQIIDGILEDHRK